MSTSTSLPLSARFALWFNAWAAGTVSLDDARDGVVGADTAHDVHGVPDQDGPVPMIVAMGRLRVEGATWAGIALPVPGDPLGLAGPPGFNTDALDIGEAVIFEGTDLGIVPRRAGAGVVWACSRAVSRRQIPDPSEADSFLRRALVEVAGNLAELDVARWRPEVADELMALRRTVDLSVPPGMAPRAVKLVALANRCRTIAALALDDDDGAAVTAREADLRRAALGPLDHAARRGLVAACSFPFER